MYSVCMPKLTEATKEARRQQVLDAAMTCFIDGGYAATSMAQIIEKSGLSSGSIYSHFSSKDEILRDIIERNIEVIKNTFSNHQEILTPREVAGYFQEKFEVNRGASLLMTVWGDASVNTATANTIASTVAEMTEFITELLLPWARANLPVDRTAPEHAARTAKIVMAVAHGCFFRVSVDQSVNITQFFNDAVALLPE